MLNRKYCNPSNELHSFFLVSHHPVLPCPLNTLFKELHYSLLRPSAPCVRLNQAHLKWLSLFPDYSNEMDNNRDEEVF